MRTAATTDTAIKTRKQNQEDPETSAIEARKQNQEDPAASAIEARKQNQEDPATLPEPPHLLLTHPV